MRHDGIPYIPNVGKPLPPIPLEEMDLQQIVKMRLRNCVKSGGIVTKCRDCENKCADGRRALELLYSTKVPGTDAVVAVNQTILERMRKEKEESEKKKETEKPKPIVLKNGAMRLEGWYTEAAKQEDPIKWIMDTFDISKTRARQKVYVWNHDHKNEILIDANGRKRDASSESEKPAETSKPDTQNSTQEKQPDVSVKPVEQGEALKSVLGSISLDDVENDNSSFVSVMKKKIDSLVHDREMYKAQADKWISLYKSVDDKVTALNMALEAFTDSV